MATVPWSRPWWQPSGKRATTLWRTAPGRGSATLWRPREPGSGRGRRGGSQIGGWCEEMKWLIWLKRALLQKHIISESCHSVEGPSWHHMIDCESVLFTPCPVRCAGERSWTGSRPLTWRGQPRRPQRWRARRSRKTATCLNTCWPSLVDRYVPLVALHEKNRGRGHPRLYRLSFLAFSPLTRKFLPPAPRTLSMHEMGVNDL